VVGLAAAGAEEAVVHGTDRKTRLKKPADIASATPAGTRASGSAPGARARRVKPLKKQPRPRKKLTGCAPRGASTGGGVGRATTGCTPGS
jgi:hypothetical protein